MARPCEVCSSLEARGHGPAPRRKLRRVLIGERIVALCDEHAAEVQLAGVQTGAALARLFPEPGGTRSLIVRRAPLDRRVFPPRPEGRRRTDGRRTEDHGSET